jgi:hypothetical protein
MLKLVSLRLETGRHDAPCSRVLQPAWKEGSQTDVNGSNRTDMHRASAANFRSHR